MRFPNRDAWRSLVLGCSPVFFLAIGLSLAAAQNATVEAKAPGKDPIQPIAFDHKLHSAKGLNCSSCHSNPDPGETMSIPDADICMACHQTIAANRPQIVKLSEFARSKKPIPWVRIYSLPGFVYWSHRTHLSARQACESCHGDVANMPVIRATKVTTMDGCVDCHSKKDANTGCSGCHEGQSS